MLEGIKFNDKVSISEDEFSRTLKQMVEASGATLTPSLELLFDQLAYFFVLSGRAQVELEDSVKDLQESFALLEDAQHQMKKLNTKLSKATNFIYAISKANPDRTTVSELALKAEQFLADLEKDTSSRPLVQ